MKKKTLLQLWFAQATAFTAIMILYALCALTFEIRMLLLLLLCYVGAWIVKLPEYLCHKLYVQYNQHPTRKRIGEKLRSFRMILWTDLLICIGCGVLTFLIGHDIEIAKLVFLVFLMSDALGLILMPRDFDSY